ncbi:MAG: hypothetical protein HY514_03410 [Candidatus Aenigmarchaeota archaeon]|nr:hypothetical protein [Candidatus Aenigmarchaeota archaeon]
MLKGGLKKTEEIQAQLDMQKSVTRKSSSFLKDSRLIKKQRIRGDEFYLITENGRTAIDRVYKRLSIA